MLVHKPIRSFRPSSVGIWEKCITQLAYLSNGSKWSMNRWEMENAGWKNLCRWPAAGKDLPQRSAGGTTPQAAWTQACMQITKQDTRSHNCFPICYFLFPFLSKKERKEKKQKFFPLCISAWCNGAEHLPFIIIMPVKGTLNNVNAGGKPLGVICMAALSWFSTLGVNGSQWAGLPP